MTGSFWLGNRVPFIRRKEIHRLSTAKRTRRRLVLFGVIGSTFYAIFSIFLASATRSKNPTTISTIPHPFLHVSDRTSKVKEVAGVLPESTGRTKKVFGDHSPAETVVELLNEPLSKTTKVHRLDDLSGNDNIAKDGESSSLETCQHTMVSAYFSLRSKYPAEQYLKWMANFLSLQDCMVIFTSSDMIDHIREFRAHSPTRTVLVEMSINDLPISKLGEEFWQQELDKDPEKKRHRSYQLFWIWLSKSWLVVQAIQHDFFQSERKHKGLFMWQDIGSYRNDRYNGQRILVHTEIVPPKTILWLAHHPTNPPKDPIWNAKFKEKKHYFHSGSQGVGASEAWLAYHGRFAQTVRQFLERDMFIGEDQCVLQSTCQQFPKLCAYIHASEVKDNFYFGLRYVLVTGGTFRLWRMPELPTPSATRKEDN